ncbi:MAG: tyrosine-type recombinase/integrase [Rhodanobacteraceae bacterium]
MFPGMNRVNPLTPRQLNRAIHAAAQAAGIDKRVSMHTLRHYVARRTM